VARILGFHYPERIIRLLFLRGENKECRILDIGGGTGLLAQEMIARNPGPHLEFTVLDPTAEMLKQVPDMENIKKVQGRGEELPFPENSFDRIIVIETLHHTQDPVALFSEAYRVLRRGGIMVVQEPDQDKFLIKLIIGLEKIFIRRIIRVDSQLIEDWASYAGFTGQVIFSHKGQIFWKGKKEE